MIKIIAIFMLLALNSTSANNTLLNNTSLNDTLINNSSINNTLLNNSSINNTLLNNSSINNTSLNNSSSEDDWFNKSSNLNFALPLNLFSRDIRIVDVEQVGVKFPAEQPHVTYNPIWNLIHPPEINIPTPSIDDLVPLDILLGGSRGSGVSEPVCSEDGICSEVFVD